MDADRPARRATDTGRELPLSCMDANSCTPRFLRVVGTGLTG
jgi:hypothetical protein